MSARKGNTRPSHRQSSGRPWSHNTNRWRRHTERDSSRRSRTRRTRCTRSSRYPRPGAAGAPSPVLLGSCAHSSPASPRAMPMPPSRQGRRGAAQRTTGKTRRSAWRRASLDLTRSGYRRFIQDQVGVFRAIDEAGSAGNVQANVKARARERRLSFQNDLGRYPGRILVVGVSIWPGRWRLRLSGTH